MDITKSLNLLDSSNSPNIIQHFSVLLSIYNKENKLYLIKAFESILQQKIKPNEIVLVKDGLLTTDLDSTIAEYQNKFSNLKVILLPKNQGLGKALNEGLKYCSYELVARMDTDDIARPDRFEKQIHFMETHPEIDVCSAWIDEFIGSPDNIVSRRILPETPEELYEFGKSRNPLNHPAVMFRKSAVIKAGGYQHFPLFEDYYLWVRMIMNGSKLYNLQEPLLYFRSSTEMYKRRGGLKYALTEIKFQILLHKIGYISFYQMLKNCCTRFIARIIPNQLRGFLYKRILHK